MRLEEMARHRMSRRTINSTMNSNSDVNDADAVQDGLKQGHFPQDLIISEAADWQVLTLHLAVHMQQLQAAISTGSANAGQVRVLRVEGGRQVSLA